MPDNKLKRKVVVCMATYNGESYLEEQIISIINQVNVKFQLYIRDDLSTDNTMAIIVKYKSLFPELINIIDNRGKKLGAINSFRELLKIVIADYYFLCDQDDIWYYDKISVSLNELKKIEGDDNIPCGVFSDATVIDKNKNIINRSFWKYQSLSPKIALTWKKLLVQNVVMGCSFAVNKNARDLFLTIDNSYFFHDHLLAILISKYGNISYISRPLLYYRQHQNNMQGAIKITPIYFFMKILNIRRLLYTYGELIQIFKEINIAHFLILKIIINIKRLFL